MSAAFSLDVIDVPDPCPVPWSAMTGSDRVRHCGQCRKPVYNLSAMTRGEAENLIRAKDGRLCVRFYRRADGTVATDSCNRAVRFTRRTAAVAAGVLATAFVVAWGAKRGSGGDVSPGWLDDIMDWIGLKSPFATTGKPCRVTPPAAAPEVAREPHAK